MDVSLAIWLYDPQAEYRLSHSNADKYEDILEWKGPSEMPSKKMLEELWKRYTDEKVEEPPELSIEDRLWILEDEVKKLKEKAASIKP
jgi:hypothetical protein